MSILKNLLSAAAATVLFGLGSAHASTTVIGMNSGAPGDFDVTWTVTGKQARNATTFDDYFVFNVPDEQDISFLLTASNATLDGIALYDYSTGDLLVLDLLDTPSTSLTWSDIDLTSGTYELEVAGSYSAKSGGTYGGTILGVEPAVTAPVPEPGTWALMLMGLGAMAAVTRRRQGR
jgi:hypothetical protein